MLSMVNGKFSENTAVEISISSETISLINKTEVEEGIMKSADRIKMKIDGYQQMGNNWRVLGVERHEVSLVHFNPLEGSSFVELPSSLKSDRNGLINIVNNDDDECFRWYHVRHLKPKKQKANKITGSNRKIPETLDYRGIEFPVRVEDIPKIEKANKIRITVIMLKGEKTFFPRYTSKADYDDHMEFDSDF